MPHQYRSVSRGTGSFAAPGIIQGFFFYLPQVLRLPEGKLTMQVALMVATLVVQYVDWDSPIQQLLATYTTDATAIILLDLLTEIPEEVRFHHHCYFPPSRLTCCTFFKFVCPLSPGI